MKRIWCAVTIGLALAAPARAQDATDSAVVLRGIVMRDTGSAWALFLPMSLTVGRVRSHYIHIAGNPSKIERNENRYVELQGRLHVSSDPGSASMTLADGKLKALGVPGEGAHSVQRTFMEHAEVAAGIVPNKFAFPDSAGADRTRPVITFAISNHSDAPIDFTFRDNKVICSNVVPSGRAMEPIWHDSWSVGPYLTQLRINLSATVWEAVPLPDTVTFLPGHYRLRVWLCEAPDYTAETDFDVAGS